MLPFMKGESGFSASSTAEEVLRGIDGSGLTAIVTGAASGIGCETSRALASQGVHVVMGVRDMAAGQKVKNSILTETPSAKVDILKLDLSCMESVRTFASSYNSKSYPLNILINNAGIMFTPFSLSKDCIELQFATNHLGHYLLSYLLLENMVNTAAKSKREGRIVNVSSEAHRMTYSNGIRFEKISDEACYNRSLAYGQSKLANVLHANELARRLKKDGALVTSNSLHPGIVQTNLFRDMGIVNSLVRSTGGLFMKNAQQGAATTCYVAMHPKVRGVSGAYFCDSNLSTPSALAMDRVLANKLWDFSLNLLR